jgi:hypothetical protein
LPRAFARLRIPAAALGLKEYLGWASGSKMSDNEDATTALGDSEELRVKNSPRQAIPELAQGIEDDREITSASGSKEAWNVLDDDPLRQRLPRDADELPEERRARVLEAPPFPRDREPLTRESPGEYVNAFEFGSLDLTDVPIVFHSWKVTFQYPGAESVVLNLPPRLKARALQREVEAADAGEERAVSEDGITLLGVRAGSA